MTATEVTRWSNLKKNTTGPGVELIINAFKFMAKCAVGKRREEEVVILVFGTDFKPLHLELSGISINPEGGFDIVGISNYKNVKGNSDSHIAYCNFNGTQYRIRGYSPVTRTAKFPIQIAM